MILELLAYSFNCGEVWGMARPIRLEFAGAIYHVTSRGDRREDIYDTDAKSMGSDSIDLAGSWY